MSNVRFAEAKSTKISGEVVAVPVWLGGGLSAAGKALDKGLSGLLSAAIKSEAFEGKAGQSIVVHTPAKAVVGRVVLVGAGDAKKFDEKAALTLGGATMAALLKTKAKTAQAVFDLSSKKLSAAEAAGAFGGGLALRDYRFDKYFTTKKPSEKEQLKSVSVLVTGAAKAKAAYKTQEAIANAVHFSRDLVTEPGNIIYPETLAEACKKLTPLGVKVEVLKPAQMKKMGMGALLGVAQGSAFEPRLVVMTYNGAAKSSKPVAFVGKGVTFDSGGISIKPSGGMEEMKWDMGGSAAVIGVMHALAGRKAKVNAVGVVGLVENMPSGTAQRPGDVVTSMSGQTIEVLNTDAEGRLVLADALWYTHTRFKPRSIINLATLTGAIIVSIGSVRAGLFSNNDALAKQLQDAGDDTDELLWPFPMDDAYDRMIDSDIADMQNIGRDREAGSITAATFLQRFVKDYPWAHLDIAGTAWSKKEKPYHPKGGTGFGVRLLNHWVSKYVEGK